jgi:hypothetical protein
VLSANKLAVHHDSDSDAVRNTDVDDIGEHESVAASRPYLRKRTSLAGVLEMYLGAREFLRQRLEQIYVSPP